MDAAIRHRFLGVSSSSSAGAAQDGDGIGDELNQDDILWTNNDSSTGSTTANNNKNTNGDNDTNKNNHNRRASFPQNSGILAALPEFNHQSVIYRKPTVLPSQSRAIPLKSRPLLPNGEKEYSSQSVPARKLNQSAPMNIPVLSIAMAKQRKSRFREEDEEDDGDEEMLPPHEIVARGSRRSPKTTFSVLEGVGRTLKGRDLRQVRNAVWRQTGFLD